MAYDTKAAAAIASLKAQIDNLPDNSIEYQDGLISQIANLTQSLEPLGGRSVVTSYDLAETQTASTGTNWTALASGATKNITVRNRTGTNIDIRKVGGSVFFSLVDGDDVPLPVLANSNEWEIRRTDTSNTQVTVKFLRFA
jgi:predicted PurR-regulated permease PerM